MPTKKQASSSNTTKKKSDKNLRSKIKKNSSKATVVKPIVSRHKFYDQLNLSDSYISLILGAIVVSVIGLIFVVFFYQDSVARRGNRTSQEVLNSSATPMIKKAPTEKTYIMQENETLWDVAVEFYGDGFRYTEIVEANNLENPDFVPPGTKIIIPDSE